MDFAEPCPLVRPGLPLFGFCSSGRSFASALLSGGASRRPPLRLASPLSHRTWAEDFHLPAVKHARHTRSRGRQERAHRCLENAPTRFPHRPPPTTNLGKQEERPGLRAGKESDNTHGTYRVAAFQTFLSDRI